MNYRNILFFLGVFSLSVSFFSIVNIFYSIYFDFALGLNSYLVSFAASFIIGILFCFIGKNNTKNISIYDQIILLFIGFFFIPMLISLPFYLSNYNIGLVNSYFESVSGFTATGFSIIDDVEKIDEPLLLWRSSSQWLGGLFFLIAIAGTLGRKRIKIKPIYLISGANIRGNFYNDFNSNFIKIFIIYSLSTIFVIFLYGMVNIRLFDSFNLAFTTLSAGGFLPKNNLSEITTNNFQILILSLTLLFPIINFYLIIKIFSKQFNFRDHQEDFHLMVTIVMLTLIFYFFVINNEGLANVFLAITSSISTSGISTYSTNLDLSLFFILLTVVGGSAMSTSSGLKYVRFYILLKISYQEIYKLVKPINIFNNSLFGSETKIAEEDSKISFLIFISFIAAIFILSGILTLDSISFEDSFKLSILTLTNTVSSNLYGVENLNFFNMNVSTKIALIFFMIFGKIEIIAILFLITKRFLQ